MRIEYRREKPEPDPPHPTGDGEPMSGAMLRAARDGMGLSDSGAAVAYGVAKRTILRWEAAERVPTAASLRTEHLRAVTAEAVAAARRLSARGETVLIRKSGFRLIDGADVLPESWWRAVVGRAGIPAQWAQD